MLCHRGILVSSTASLARRCAAVRGFATAADSPVAPGRGHKVVVVGGGSAGLAISHQLLRTGRFVQNDIAVIDPATFHDYQPGWTLVGGGLDNKEDFRRPLAGLVDPKLKFYNQPVANFSPNDNAVTLGNGDKVNYEQLVVAPGIQVNFDSIPGLREALADKSSLVSSIYGYDSCSKVWPTIEAFERGHAIFTHPAGPVKCAGAPQKIMWMALDAWAKSGLYRPKLPDSAIKISFAIPSPGMFGVPKYSAILEQLRQERGVEGLFQHDLISIDDGNSATFKQLNTGETVKKEFNFLHVVPKMGPFSFVKNSPIANEAGFVHVDDATLQHKKYPNIWSAGDASSMPVSKTAAAITSQAPVLVHNLLNTIDGKPADAVYDGYASCPLVTEYGKVLLAEFKYGNIPKETFSSIPGLDQSSPRRLFYHLKKDFFPWVYFRSMVKGTWGGPKGWL